MSADISQTSQGPDEALFGQAESARKAGRGSEARRLYEALTKRFRTSRRVDQAYFWQGELLFQAGKYAEAAGRYREIVRRYPRSRFLSEAWYGLGWTHLKAEAWEPALDCFEHVVKGGSEPSLVAAALCQAGDIWIERKAYDRALAAYDRVLGEFPQSAVAGHAQYHAGLALFKRESFDAAALAFQAVLVHFPDSPFCEKAAYQLALTEYRRQDFKAAERAWENFFERHPKSMLALPARFQQGLCFFGLGKYPMAMEIFERTLRESKDPELLEMAEVERSHLLARMGKEEDGTRALEQFLRRHPKSRFVPEVWFWLGERAYQARDYDGALGFFERVIRDFPDSDFADDAIYQTGLADAAEGRAAAAGEAFHQLLERHPDSPLAADAAAQLRELLPGKGHGTEAMGGLEALAARYRGAPCEKFIRFAIAECREESGDRGAAAVAYTEIAYLFPEDRALQSKALLRAARLLESLERWDDAEKAYGKLAQASTDEAVLARERLEWIRVRR